MALFYILKHYGSLGVKRRIKKNLNSTPIFNTMRVNLVRNHEENILKDLGVLVRDYTLIQDQKQLDNLSSFIRENYGVVRNFSKFMDWVADRFVRCECCDRYSIPSNEHPYICQDCMDNQYIYSELMGEYIRQDCVCNSVDGIATEDWFHDNGYVYNSTDGAFVIRHRVWPTHVLGYHESKQYVGKVDDEREDKQINPLYCGFELELECSKDEDEDENYDELQHVANKITKALRRKDDSRCYICAEEDGSIDFGFELVSSYTGIDTHWSRLSNITNLLDYCDESNNTGLHVHVSRNKLSLYTCAKVASFMSSPANESFLNQFARRRPNSYWKRKTKSELAESFRNAKRRGVQSLNLDRYEIVNFQNKNTIEFRLYKSSTLGSTIMACIEFSRAVVAYCRIAGLHELTINDLFRWVYRPENKLDTIRLRDYMKRNFNAIHVTYAPIEKPNRSKTLVATS